MFANLANVTCKTRDKGQQEKSVEYSFYHLLNPLWSIQISGRKQGKRHNKLINETIFTNQGKLKVAYVRVLITGCI